MVLTLIKMVFINLQHVPDVTPDGDDAALVDVADGGPVVDVAVALAVAVVDRELLHGNNAGAAHLKVGRLEKITYINKL